MDRRLALLMAVGAVVIGALTWRYVPGQTRWIAISISYVCIGAFTATIGHRPRTGLVMAAFGLCVCAFIAEVTRIPLLWTLGSALEPAWLLPMAYLLLAFPRERLVARLERTIVGFWIVLVIYNVFGSTFYDPRQFGCADCQVNLNLLLVHPSFDFVMTSGRVTAPLIVGALCLLVAILVKRWWSATPPARRVLSPMLLPAIAFLFAVASQQAIAFILGLWSIWNPQPWVFTTITNVATASALLLPWTFLLGFARGRARRVRVSDLVIKLDDLPSSQKLEQALATALGDPSVALGRWDATSRSYVSTTGQPLVVPSPGDERVATFLDRDDNPLAVIVHDPALVQEDGLLDSVTAATRLAVDNERLNQALSAQLEEVRASRARIVQATDDERRRLERDLHDGAQQRLVALTLQLRSIEAKLSESTEPWLRDALESAADSLTAAMSELRELARGIHPSILTEEGLGPALQSLIDRSTTPAVLTGVPQRRYPASVEATAYFVVAEAITNVAKHAEASSVTVSVAENDGLLTVEVGDDGLGGADPERGSGLQGLTDRVGAIGGRVDVKSSPGDGTRITAEFPCA